MAHPVEHAKNSARKFGGVLEDYLPVHQWFDESKSMTGFGEDRYALADRMGAAWAAFARTGNPNAKGLPSWSPFKLDTRATMILGNECRLSNDPNRDERLALSALRTPA